MNKLFSSYTYSKELFDAKKRFGQLLFFSIGSYQGIYRKLSIEEVELSTSFKEMPDCYVEDWILDQTRIMDTCDLDNIPAGYAEAIASSILAQSSISDEKEFFEILDGHRNGLSVKTVIEDFIATAFKDLSTQDIRDMDQAKQLEFVARAENKLGVKIGVKPENRGPRAAKGFESIGGEDVGIDLSPAGADFPDFEKDNADMM